MAAPMSFFLALAALMALNVTLAMPTNQYDADRQLLLEKDQMTVIGSNQPLDEAEQYVSDAMKKEKTTLMENSRHKREEYSPSWSYFRSKPIMERTMLFKLITMMPKGAALHLHDMAITSLDWVVKNATYRKDLYMCVNSDHLMLFKFSAKKPTADKDCDSWNSVEQERSMAKSVDVFDENIKKNLSMLGTDPLVTYPTITQAWNRFMGYFGQVSKIIFYKPVFRDYFWQALQEFHDDNVQYIELRGLMEGLYDLAGTAYTRKDVFDLYMQVAKEFTDSHPGFTGAKFIMSGIRAFSKPEILKEIKETMDMRDKHPDYMLGYDLVGQEDPNYSLLHYRDELLYPGQLSPPKNLPYFFHAAETNFQQAETDYNLIDAIILNTTRIGHGYGLGKHPHLMEIIKTRDIAVEVNPISNQVLGLVKDPRNHAAVPLLADDFPIVISSDDPATWEAKPLSSDFYVTYMNMLGEDSNLKSLKQLAINSIKYSGMSGEEKAAAMSKWEVSWKEFIADAKTVIDAKDKDSSSEDLQFCPHDSADPQCP